MVTATYGTAVFTGQSGKIYNVDFYIADVVGTAVKFDSGSGAGTGSLPFWKAPEKCLLTDISIVTGPTVMVALVPTADGGTIPGVRFRIANFLNSLATRASVRLGFNAGTNVGFTEA